MLYHVDRYIADAMLGKLAKWLRVMGYDTYYQPVYSDVKIEQLIREGRLLLSRNKSLAEKYENSFHIGSERINEQLAALRDNGFFDSPGEWFSRCPLCNEKLILISPIEASGNIPDYIFQQNGKIVRNCRQCNRYYWPGSHRDRMMNQLRKWALSHNHIHS